MKKLLALLIAFGLVVVTTGCPGTDTKKKAEKGKAEKAKEEKAKEEKAKEEKAKADKGTPAKNEVMLEAMMADIVVEKDKGGSGDLTVKVDRKGGVEDVKVVVTLPEGKGKVEPADKTLKKEEKEATFKITLDKSVKEGEDIEATVKATGKDASAEKTAKFKAKKKE